MSDADWRLYGLGFFTPFLILLVVGSAMWLKDEAKGWWRNQEPTLARVRCFLGGHAFTPDNGWVVCRRCGHAARDPQDRKSVLRTDR